jgi:hypothetical protein
MVLTEPTIAELNKKVDERHEEVSARLEQLSVGMNDIRQLILSRQNDGEEHSSHRSQPSKGNRHDGPQQHYATRISKIDFPRFDGKKMKEWLYKCDQFFALDATPDDSRVRLASILLEGPVLQWNNAREQNCRCKKNATYITIKLLFNLYLSKSQCFLLQLAAYCCLQDYL